MKHLSVVFVIFLLYSYSIAKDSVWALGDDDKVALNLLEHRIGPTARATEITLIIGNWFLVGQLKANADGEYPDSSPITLKTKSAKFVGTISLGFGDTVKVKGKQRSSGQRAILKGKLTLQGASSNLNEIIHYHILTGL